jgi:hypothetical protein
MRSHAIASAAAHQAPYAYTETPLGNVRDRTCESQKTAQATTIIPPGSKATGASKQQREERYQP